MSKSWVILLAFLLSGCVRLPDTVLPVEGFELERYLGRWYEIARLDHSFERGLTQVTADYSLRDDGGIRVINRGYSQASGQWKEAEGAAYFVESADLGYLKVSFFGPFYGAYGIFELDRAYYQYALVSGPDISYLWLLARTPTISAMLREQLVSQAARRGFDTSKLIWVNQAGHDRR